MRKATIAPLGREQRLQLAQRTIEVDVSQADADESAVPAPLVRVEARCRSGPITQIVAMENRESTALECVGW